MRIVETILESKTLLIANKDSWKVKWKREKIENLAMLLQGAINAESKVGLKMNVHKGKLSKVLKLLESLHSPTISPESDEGWCAVEVIIDVDNVKTLLPALKRAGAEGIVEYPLNKVIY